MSVSVDAEENKGVLRSNALCNSANKGVPEKAAIFMTFLRGVGGKHCESNVANGEYNLHDPGRLNENGGDIFRKAPANPYLHSTGSARRRANDVHDVVVALKFPLVFDAALLHTDDPKVFGGEHGIEQCGAGSGGKALLDQSLFLMTRV